ncbi:hypothetical protein GCM10010532_060780 [Dactylosporangium siamense]|uniref:Uncharacterized protein n=1 Tax=Dactylosporangium siamense TaxID=685454 RepID=A0A919PX52_9ACTN|nr:hypothetical protein Dsi01nite_081590 [Dactylosporangium siamense]
MPASGRDRRSRTNATVTAARVSAKPTHRGRTRVRLAAVTHIGAVLMRVQCASEMETA